jgi:hypothetical protein
MNEKPAIPQVSEGCPDSCRSLIGKVTLRFLGFTAMVFAFILLIWWVAQSRGAELFSEGGLLEWIQFVILLATAAVFVCAGYGVRAFRELCFLLAALPCMAAVRELDADFDRWLGAFGWQLPFYVILLGAGIYGIRMRAAIFNQLQPFIQHRAFGILWAGFIIAIPFAQMIGNSDFLRALFDEDYQRPFKRLIEECTEVIGYLIIFLGAVDWAMDARGITKNKSCGA